MMNHKLFEQETLNALSGALGEYLKRHKEIMERPGMTQNISPEVASMMLSFIENLKEDLEAGIFGINDNKSDYLEAATIILQKIKDGNE